MPGYSGTPLPKKLGIKAGFRVWLNDAPREVRAELKAALAACEMAADGKTPLDLAMVFTKSKAELAQKFTQIAKCLAPAGMLWICLLYTSPSPRDGLLSRMPSSA